ncbi:MAG: DedA family protein [Actinobacteria bacterium]|nr:MAG: DedA family protein [Actinomycetota bacterium]
MLASLTGSVTTFVGDHGVYAVFLLMAVDAVFPAASELVMVYAGALASGAFPGQHVVLFGHHISDPAWAFVTMALAGTIGYVLGSLVGWWAGRRGGRPLAEQHGRLLHLGPERLERAERWFERWGSWSVLLGRITPVVRSFVSIPAGIFRMPLGPYTALTIPGSLVWCFAFAGVGWAAGKSYAHFHHAFDYVEIAVVAGAVLLAGYLILRRRSSRLSPRA